jgi:hypothetical protein
MFLTTVWRSRRNGAIRRRTLHGAGFPLSSLCVTSQWSSVSCGRVVVARTHSKRFAGTVAADPNSCSSPAVRSQNHGVRTTLAIRRNPPYPLGFASHWFEPLAGVSHPPRTKCGPNQTARVRESHRRSDPSCLHDRCLLPIYVSMLSLAPHSHHRSKHRCSTQLAPEFATSEFQTGAALPHYSMIRSIATTHQRVARFAVL